MNRIRHLVPLLLVGLFVGSIGLACDNPFFPVREGATWTYRVSTPGAADTVYTHELRDVTPDGFTLVQIFEEESFGIRWLCVEGGLLASEFTVPVEGMTFETLAADGVTYPARLAVGDRWENVLRIEGSMAQEGMEMAMRGEITTTNTVVRQESVSVAAGSFDAFVVDAPFEMDLSASVMGMSIPMRMGGDSTTWLAAGVGPVRSTSQGSVTELIEYRIP